MASPEQSELAKPGISLSRHRRALELAALAASAARQSKSRAGVPHGLFKRVAAFRSATSAKFADAAMVADEAGKFLTAQCRPARLGMAMPQCGG
jgi:hypothetical protein